MTEKVVGKALPVLTKMSQKYFQRKLAYFSQGPDPNMKLNSFLYQRDTFIRNFKEFFPQYSKNKSLVDDFMQWLAGERLKEKELWDEYGRFVLQNLEGYQTKNLVKIAELLEKHSELPSEFTQKLEQRTIHSLQSLSTNDFATVWRLTKSEAILTKIKSEGRIIINTDYDLMFFTSVYLPKAAMYPDVVELLLSQTTRVLPFITNVPSICHILKQFSLCRVPIPNSTFKAIEAAILSAGTPFRPLDVSEILLTIRTETYFDRVSLYFWEQFEAKLISNVDQFEPSWLLSTIARYQFPSPEILSHCIPLWIKAIDIRHDKDKFREGLCAIAKFGEVDEPTKDWCAAKIEEYKEQFSVFDISTMIRAMVAPGWYKEAMWKPLMERFFSKKGKPPRDIDKAMIYFAIKAMELDQAGMAAIDDIVREKRESLREAFTKVRFQPKNIAIHTSVKAALQSLQVDFTEFDVICDIYNSNFTLKTDNIVIVCQEWPYHLTAGTKKLTAGTQMMLRHFNKAGLKAVIIANDTDIHIHLADVLNKARASTSVANFQIV